MEKQVVQAEKYHTHITSKRRCLERNLKKVWRCRNLSVLFTKRTFAVSYKQTILGSVWFFLQLLISSLMDAFVFGWIAGIGTDGEVEKAIIPYEQWVTNKKYRNGIRQCTGWVIRR